MKLDVYRSCSWREKRLVLETFWHRGRLGTEKVTEAAAQYGPWAVIALVVLAVELVPFIVLGLLHSPVIGVAAILVEVITLLSLWLAVIRTSDLRAAIAHSA